LFVCLRVLTADEESGRKDISTTGRTQFSDDRFAGGIVEELL